MSPESATGAIEIALVLAAVGLMMMPDQPRMRVADAEPRTATTGAGSARRSLVGAIALAGAGLILVPEWWWLVVAASGLTWWLLSRRPTGRTAAQRVADRQVVAVYAELLAACLDAGMAVGPALRAVSDVLDDRRSPVDEVPVLTEPAVDAGSRVPLRGATVGGRTRAGPPAADPGGPVAVLDAVAAMLSLGANPATAWRLADLDENLAPLAAAARRSAAGGGGLAQAVREHAAQLRAQTAAAAVRAAGRAGVLMTAPLGICFLPAFLCLGLAPVVVGLLGQLQIF